MTLNLEQQRAIENGESVFHSLESDFHESPWTKTEIDLLADEAEAMISMAECPAQALWVALP